MLPVMWYGDSSKGPEDLVEVVPIFCDAVEAETGGADDVGDMGCMGGSGLQATASNDTTVTIDSRADSGDHGDSMDIHPASNRIVSHHSTSTTHRLRRKDLTPLDDEMLSVYCRHKLTSHLSGALIDFAEWDDHLRDSYVWPEAVTDLLR